MTAHAPIGWQTLLADLSLILFMVTAATMSQRPAMPAQATTPPRPSARAEPLAVWRAGGNAPPLARWLAEQPADPRQQLTITARYAPGGRAAALARAEALAEAAGAPAAEARIVTEPGVAETFAALAYDRAPNKESSR